MNVIQMAINCMTKIDCLASQLYLKCISKRREIRKVRKIEEKKFLILISLYLALVFLCSNIIHSIYIVNPQEPNNYKHSIPFPHSNFLVPPRHHGDIVRLLGSSRSLLVQPIK